MPRSIPTCLVLSSVLLFAAAPVLAADPVFPPGSRVGLTPPQGFVPAKTFPGFENPEKSGQIIITELPTSAYADLDGKVAEDQLRRQGVVVESREPLALSTGPAFLVTGEQQAGGQMVRRWILVGSTARLTAIVSMQVPDAEKAAYPDAEVRAALATLSVRATAPPEEQLDTLPFTLGDRAGFHLVRVLAGSAALLTDGAGENFDVAEQPVVLITVAPGSAPHDPSERDRFSRGVLAETPGIKDIRLVRSEPLRMGGQQGYESVAEARDIKSNAEIMVAQWLRFGHAGHLRILGMARKDAWPAVFSRIRAIRDGIELR